MKQGRRNNRDPNVFGEMGVMTGERRTASVIAATEVECYRIDKEVFQSVLRTRPEMLEIISQVIARRRVELAAVREGLDAEAKKRRVKEERNQILSSIQQADIKEQRLSLVPADGSAPLRPVSPADLFVYEYAWRPDGGAFAVTAARGSGDDNWWFAQLYLIDAGDGAARLVYKPALQICEPAFSPDGARIAFIEGLMSDAGSNGGDVFVVPADGGKRPRNLTKGLRGSAATVRWIKPEEILFGLQIEGDSAFAAVPADGPGKVRILWRGSENLSNGWPVGASFSADGALSASVRESFTAPPEVVAGPLGAWQPLTSRNAQLRSPAGAARSVTWKSDKYQAQGWLLAPSSPPPPGEKAAMVVLVHGGPASAVRANWSSQALLLASQGYYVFMPNPRGSFGQGTSSRAPTSRTWAAATCATSCAAWTRPSAARRWIPSAWE